MESVEGGVLGYTTRARPAWGPLTVLTVIGLLAACSSGRPADSGATFVHPGVLVSRAQLDFVKQQVARNAQPWKSAYDDMIASEFATITRAPRPRRVVDCGSSDHPNNGCSDERHDAISAYTGALAYYISGQARYAQQSIAIMDAWSGMLTGHTNSNAPLQSAWAASVWTRAAEIVKHAYPGAWHGAKRFATFLRAVYLPEVINGSASNGNWELSMTEASIGIAIFVEDRAVFDKAVSMYLNRVPAYIYLSRDGPLPKIAGRNNQRTPDEIIKYWAGQIPLVDGVTQETCRDFAHTGYGLSAIAHIAETSRIQGNDLYSQVYERLHAAWELHAKYQLGEPMPEWLCGGHFVRSLGPTTEVAYNALSRRMNLDMPYTARLTEQLRPQGQDIFSVWETLTHAANPY